jgi:large subunit ribosomal protein L28
MSRYCPVTGRRTRVGNAVARRGLAKAKGGVGLRCTGRTKRKFKPNIQKIRVVLPDGTVTRVKLSTKAMKSGKVGIEKGDRVVIVPLVKAARGRAKKQSA